MANHSPNPPCWLVSGYSSRCYTRSKNTPLLTSTNSPNPPFPKSEPVHRPASDCVEIYARAWATYFPERRTLGLGGRFDAFFFELAEGVDAKTFVFGGGGFLDDVAAGEAELFIDVL